MGISRHFSIFPSLGLWGCSLTEVKEVALFLGSVRYLPVCFSGVPAMCGTADSLGWVAELSVPCLCCHRAAHMAMGDGCSMKAVPDCHSCRSGFILWTYQGQSSRDVNASFRLLHALRDLAVLQYDRGSLCGPGRLNVPFWACNLMGNQNHCFPMSLPPFKLPMLT